MHVLKTPLIISEKVKKYLLKNNLLNKDYKIGHSKKFIYFPVSNKSIAKRFNEVSISRKKLEKRIVNSYKDLLTNKLTKNEIGLLPSSFDIIGDIAIIDLKKPLLKKKRLIAEALLNSLKNVKTILRKKQVIQGRYRTHKLEWLAGKRKKETIHKESGVLIKLNVQEVYFSPRLSNERLRISKEVKQNENILLPFSGVLPYALVIAKKHNVKFFCIEINPKAEKYSKQNIKLNKLESKIKFVKGDAKKILPKLKQNFDRAIMPSPTNAIDFLDEILKHLNKKAKIHLYSFSDKLDSVKQKINKYKCLKIKKITKCGQYSPRQYRICIDLVKTR